MNTPYFQSSPRQTELRAICATWGGTPFVPSSQIKGAGGGVDCARFVYAVLREAGAVGAYDFSTERYAILGDGPANLAIITRIVTALGLIPTTEDLLPGDVLVFTRRARNHMAVAAGGEKIWHVIKGPGVIESRLKDLQILGDLVGTYRAMEVTP